jgi:hypothetical protein
MMRLTVLQMIGVWAAAVGIWGVLWLGLSDHCLRDRFWPHFYCQAYFWLSGEQ